MSSASVYSVGPAAGRPSSQIRCGASPCPNFTTRPAPDVPWIAHGCCSRHTRCDRKHTCTVCESWTEETWVGFDSWMTKRIQRSERDAAYRARKTKARRERSRSPRSDKPSGLPLERSRARTRRTAPAVTPAAAGSAVNTAIAGNAVNTATAVNRGGCGKSRNRGNICGNLRNCGDFRNRGVSLFYRICGEEIWGKISHSWTQEEISQEGRAFNSSSWRVTSNEEAPRGCCS